MNLTTSVNKALFNSTRYVSFFDKLFVKERLPLCRERNLKTDLFSSWKIILLADDLLCLYRKRSAFLSGSCFLFLEPRKKLSFHVKSSTTESLRFQCNYRHNFSVPPFDAPHLVSFLSFLTNPKHFYLQRTLIFDVYSLVESIANKYQVQIKVR